MLNLKESEGGVIFEVIVKPSSRKNEITGIQNACLKMKVISPPVDGRANQECLHFIASTLGIKRKEVEIISGHKGRKKRIFIKNITSKELKNRLNHLIE